MSSNAAEVTFTVTISVNAEQARTYAKGYHLDEASVPGHLRETAPVDVRRVVEDLYWHGKLAAVAMHGPA